MTEGDALHNGQGSQWQLLLHFVAPDGSAGERQSVERVTGAVRELGLPPADVARIVRAVSEGLRPATQREERDQHNLPILIRLWILNLSPGDPLLSSSEAERAGQQKRRGWGFFLLERQEGDPQAMQVESRRVVELYLYQETARVK